MEKLLIPCSKIGRSICRRFDSILQSFAKPFPASRSTMNHLIKGICGICLGWVCAAIESIIYANFYKYFLCACLILVLWKLQFIHTRTLSMWIVWVSEWVVVNTTKWKINCENKTSFVRSMFKFKYYNPNKMRVALHSLVVTLSMPLCARGHESSKIFFVRCQFADWIYTMDHVCLVLCVASIDVDFKICVLCIFIEANQLIFYAPNTWRKMSLTVLFPYFYRDFTNLPA